MCEHVWTRFAPKLQTGPRAVRGRPFCLPWTPCYLWLVLRAMFLNKVHPEFMWAYGLNLAKCGFKGHPKMSTGSIPKPFQAETFVEPADFYFGKSILNIHELYTIPVTHPIFQITSHKREPTHFFLGKANHILWAGWGSHMPTGHHFTMSPAGRVPKNGWCISWKIPSFEMDVDWGYPHFRKPPHCKLTTEWGCVCVCAGVCVCVCL